MPELLVAGAVVRGHLARNASHWQPQSATNTLPMASCLGGTALWCHHAPELLPPLCVASVLPLLLPCMDHVGCLDPYAGSAFGEPDLEHLMCLKLVSSLCMHVAFQMAGSRTPCAPLASTGVPGALGLEVLVVQPASWRFPAASQPLA